ncbi:MAG: diacylglycerol kinase [Planctomycetia bacterium]|nr:diacylglycerol kinase [Planctomycetia bacterium]
MTLLPPSRPGFSEPVYDPGWDAPSSARPKPRRKWREKFADAFRGVKLGVRGHSSFFVHFFCAALALTAGVVLRCDYWDWCLLVLCIGLVLTAELFNSTIETLFHGLDQFTKDRIKGCLDIAAGAVLLASATAVIVGSIIFLRRLALLIWPV